MRIAITGSLGLIGSNLLDALQQTRIFQITSYDLRYNKCSSNYLDITNKQDVVTKLSNFDVIIHLAAIARVETAEKSPVFCNKVNIEGTQNIIDVCLSSHKKPYLIFASSREVYGNQEFLPVPESAYLNPINTYAKSKLLCEELIKEAQTKGLKAFIARFSNLYGGMYDHKTRVIPAFCINALKNQDIIIKGNNTILDFIFIDDVTDVILKIINYMIQNTINFVPIVNISSSNSTSLKELAEVIIKLTESSSKIVNLPQETFAVDQFIGSNGLANKMLGWKPRFALESGIRKFIDNLNNKIKGSIDLETINMRLNEDENFKSYSWLPSEI